MALVHVVGGNHGGVGAFPEVAPLRLRLYVNPQMPLPLKEKSIGLVVGLVAHRYIVKPIIKEKMYAVLDEAISSIRSNYRVILVKDMYNTVVVKIQQILYIYSNARKRCLVTLDGEIETWEQLKSIYEKLPQEQFAYAQKGFVVNYKMIKKLNKTGVELVNGENVPISRGMKNEFFANYFEFLGK